MGDPKKLKKKYATPAHPWSKATIEEQRELTKKYGLANKKEIHIAQSFLKKYKDLAKKMIALKTKQAEREQQQILQKLQKLGLLPAGAELHQILGMEVEDVLERRLQSVVFRKGFARSMKQARQFITHRHIVAGNKEITSPSYLITLEEESGLTFKTRSPLAHEDHPERISVVEEITEEAEELRSARKAAKKEKEGKAINEKK